MPWRTESPDMPPNAPWLSPLKEAVKKTAPGRRLQRIRSKVRYASPMWLFGLKVRNALSRKLKVGIGPITEKENTLGFRKWHVDPIVNGINRAHTRYVCNVFFPGDDLARFLQEVALEVVSLEGQPSGFVVVLDQFPPQVVGLGLALGHVAVDQALAQRHPFASLIARPQPVRPVESTCQPVRPDCSILSISDRICPFLTGSGPSSAAPAVTPGSARPIADTAESKTVANRSVQRGRFRAFRPNRSRPIPIVR